MTKRRTTLPETMKIRDILAEVLTKTNHRDKKGQPIWAYPAGVSDETVAKQVSPELDRHHVAHIRNQLFGPVIGRASETSLEDRVARLEEIVRDLCHGLGIPCQN